MKLIFPKSKEGISVEKIQSHIMDFSALKNSIPYLFS